MSARKVIDAIEDLYKRYKETDSTILSNKGKLLKLGKRIRKEKSKLTKDQRELYAEKLEKIKL